MIKLRLAVFDSNASALVANVLDLPAAEKGAL